LVAELAFEIDSSLKKFLYRFLHFANDKEALFSVKLSMNENKLFPGSFYQWIRPCQINIRFFNVVLEKRSKQSPSSSVIVAESDGPGTVMAMKFLFGISFDIHTCGVLVG